MFEGCRGVIKFESGCGNQGLLCRRVQVDFGRPSFGYTTQLSNNRILLQGLVTNITHGDGVVDTRAAAT